MSIEVRMTFTNPALDNMLQGRTSVHSLKIMEVLVPLVRISTKHLVLAYKTMQVRVLSTKLVMMVENTLLPGLLSTYLMFLSLVLLHLLLLKGFCKIILSKVNLTFIKAIREAGTRTKVCQSQVLVKQ